jgi:CRP-like cAMP-binding protein
MAATPINLFEMLYAYHRRYITISRDEMQQIFQHYEQAKFPKKHFLLKEGETEDRLYFIAKGMVRKYFLKGKEEINMVFAKEGQTINSIYSYYTRQPSQYYLQTLEPCVCLSMTREKMEKLLQAYPKLQEMGRLMMTEYYMHKDKLELTRLRLSTRERFLKFVGERPDLLQRLPQRHLASYLQIKPETFSRMKHLLYRKSSEEGEK